MVGRQRRWRLRLRRGAGRRLRHLPRWPGASLRRRPGGLDLLSVLGSPKAAGFVSGNGRRGQAQRRHGPRRRRRSVRPRLTRQRVLAGCVPSQRGCPAAEILQHLLFEVVELRIVRLTPISAHDHISGHPQASVPALPGHRCLWLRDRRCRPAAPLPTAVLHRERPAVTDSSTSTEMPPDHQRHSFRHPQEPPPDRMLCCNRPSWPITCIHRWRSPSLILTGYSARWTHQRPTNIPIMPGITTGSPSGGDS